MRRLDEAIVKPGDLFVEDPVPRRLKAVHIARSLGVEASEVGLSVAWSEVGATTARPPRTAGEIVTDEDGSGATALVEFLASKKFI